MPKGTRKIAFAVDPKKDYHVYRQDRPVVDESGRLRYLWSHKPGATEVTQHDSLGNFIHDPALASRNNKESNLNYTNFCGYMCVPASGPSRKKRQTGAKRTRAKASRKRTTRRAR